MSREWRLYFQDLLDFCARILAYTDNMSRTEFEANQLNYDATLRNVELLGEAAKGLPERIRQQMPDIPWREIIGVRNVLAHGYFGVNNAVLWDIITQEVPTLFKQLQAYQTRVERGEIH
jgi:uncharacterized protein with HEPN domain